MRHGRRLWIPAVTLLLAAAFFVVGGLSLVGSGASPAAPVSSAPLVHTANATPAQTIAGLQTRLRAVPRDHVAWATLGLAYVQAAKATSAPEYYPKAEGALRQSLKLSHTDNFVADAGMAALAAARHQFSHALTWAQRGLATNPANPTLYGALADAETQLGRYPEAFAATQRMIDLSPDTASLARVSYSWELRGNIPLATQYMQRALDDAANANDEAFTRYYLGELAFNAGDAAGALAQQQRALLAAPNASAPLEGKAKAEAGLGQTDAALADFALAVARVPQPSYLLEYGELLESVGRRADAQTQYKLFAVEQRLFAANGVAADVDPTLFYADHGQPARALRVAQVGVRARPFLEMQDAYAWALHVNGRDAEALEWSTKAMALGTRSAALYYHRGMIEKTLGQMDAAKNDLRQALAINPFFNPLAAPIARAALDGLGA
ncbi:MAG: hypothetical protein H0W70_01345 [Actinobacteria bacterium]|nr:hypothetical protein [Actinomycetota bacterium]